MCYNFRNNTRALLYFWYQRLHSSTVYWEKNFRNTHVRRDLNNIGKFIRAKRESTLLEGQRVGGLYGIGCMDSRKDVTEAKEECSATACCSSGCKSCRDP